MRVSLPFSSFQPCPGHQLWDPFLTCGAAGFYSVYCQDASCRRYKFDPLIDPDKDRVSYLHYFGCFERWSGWGDDDSPAPDSDTTIEECFKVPRETREKIDT